MATNICSRTRTQYVKPMELKEQLQIGKTRLYELLKMPEMQEAIQKTGEKGIRVNKDKFFEILDKLYS
jgi:hypothetical protein